ncbi:MFS transporter [Vibrio sp. 10N.222.49.A3]|uniref:MFS transporter n=1 Tax=Vibrio sp. 10N.222.49.A3 TaxID=3229611 RepID=UPI003551C808
MNKTFNVSIPNLGHSKLFVTSAILNATGGGLVMAFMLLYFSEVTDISLSVIGVSITIGRVLSSIFPMFIGRWLDDYGPKNISILGEFITGIGFLICIYARDPFLIIVSQFFIQAGSHSYWTCSRGLVTLASSGKGIHTWFGLISSIRNVGLGTGTLISSIAFTSDSLDRLHLLILASSILYFISCVVLYMWKPNEVEVKVSTSINSKAERKNFLTVLSDELYRSLLLINFGFVLSAMVIPIVIVLYCTKYLGLPAAFGGGLVILNTVIVILCSTHVAFWTKSNDKVYNLKKSFVINVLSFVLFWCASLFVDNTIIIGLILIFAMIVYTVAEMISSPAINVLSIELAPSVDNGNYMAAFQMTWSIGMAVTPALFGWLMDVGTHFMWGTVIFLMIVIWAIGFKKFKVGEYVYSN